MKKGDKVKIETGAQKPPARSGSYLDIGLENKNVTIPAGTELYHVSVNEKLTAFAPTLTCFSNNRPAVPGYIYLFKTKKNIPGIQVDEHEVRIDLGRINNQIEIIYIGTVEKDYNRAIVDEVGRLIARPLKCKFAREYKALAKKFEEESLRDWEKSLTAGEYKIVEEI